MSSSESAEHSKTKDVMKQKLGEWFHGIALKEYKVAGHEADVYGVTENGVSIHIEIVWTPARFHPNLVFLLTSDAAVRVMICSDQTLQRYSEEYERIRLEQLKKRILLTEAFRAQPVLTHDNSYLDQIRVSLVECSKNVPPGRGTQRPRSYWYINDVLVSQIVDELKPEWKAYQLISQLSLLEEELTYVPGQIDENRELDAHLVLSHRQYENLEDLLWIRSRKLLKIYGRFFAPFGVKDECLADFVWNPCYSDVLEPEILSAHLLPQFVRAEASLGPYLGAANWQKEDLFMIGRVKRHEEWQPLVVEPLFIYTSEDETEDFHLALMKRVAKTYGLDESAFEFISENFDMEKASTINDLLEDTALRKLRENCWERPLESLWTTRNALSEISRIIELSPQTYEQMLDKALSRVVLAGLIQSSTSDIRDDLSHELSLAHVVKRVLQREDTIVREITKTLGLQESPDQQKLITYYELAQEIFDGLAKAVVMEEKWYPSSESYQVVVSLQVRNRNELLKTKMREDELKRFRWLVEQVRKERLNKEK